MLTRSGSALLDVLRFGAAFMVLMSHFCRPDISFGFPDLTAAGHLAVSVFFVLSGFVIRYVSLSRESTAKQYFIDRASRIYSVTIPALLITIACEWLASAPIPWHSVPLQIGANLAFQAQDWGYEINPLHNGVFWSLSFECMYYVAYGLVFYRVRYRWPICFLLLLLAGPSIALMFPVWLLGCWSFDLYQRFRGVRYIPSILFSFLLSVLFAARVYIRRFAQLTDESHRTAWISHFVGPVPWLSRASASFVLIGILTAGLIVSALLLLDDIQIPFAGWIRTLADSTFVLYLIHLPLLILIVAMVGRPIAGWLPSTLAISFIVFLCVGLAIPLDSLKRSFRSCMNLL